MESPQLALLLSRRATLLESRSARPDAPVVEPRPHRERPPVARRTRGALATGLHHLADAVAPRCTPTGAHPAH